MSAGRGVVLGLPGAAARTSFRVFPSSGGVRAWREDEVGHPLGIVRPDLRSLLPGGRAERDHKDAF